MTPEEEAKLKNIIEDCMVKPVKEQVDLNNNITYSTLTEKKLKEFMSTLSPPYGKEIVTKEKIKDAVARVFKDSNIIPLQQPLDELILEGYGYSIGTKDKGSITVFTGSGGVRLYIEEYRKSGLPDEVIAAGIEVYLNGGYVPINILSIKVEKLSANDIIDKFNDESN